MRLIKHLSYANVMATAAVFIALGAGAYAINLGTDSVGPRQIRDDAVRGQEVRNNTIRGRDIKDDSLDGHDIREDKLDVRLFAHLESAAGSCSPATSSFETCASLNAFAEQTSKLLIIGAGVATDGMSAGIGTCHLEVDGESVNGSPLALDPPVTAKDGFALTQATGQLARGNHAVTFVCNATSGELDIDAQLSVLVLDAV